MSDHYAQTKILNCLLYESVFEFKKIFYEKLQKGLSIVYSSDQSTKEPSLDKLNKCCDARHIERNKCMYQLSDLACTFIDLDIYIYIYIGAFPRSFLLGLHTVVVYRAAGLLFTFPCPTFSGKNLVLYRWTQN